jgi:hypothetical protein
VGLELAGTVVQSCDSRGPIMKKASLVVLSTLIACGGDAAGPGSGSPASDAATDGGGAGDSTPPGAEGGAGLDSAAPLDATSTTTGDAAGLDGSHDAAGTATSPDAGDAGFVAQCLPDGTGQLDLTTQGALTLNVQLGNNAYCFGGGTGTTVGYSIGYDTVWSPGGTQHVLVNVDVPTGSRDQTGTANVRVTIQAYTNPDLSDAQQWIGSCSADITTNTQYDSNNVYLSYKIGGTVTCASPLPPSALDGGAGTGASLQVNKLDLTTGVTFGL